MASHMDVNAIVYCGDDADQIELVQREAVHNIKRVVLRQERDWRSQSDQGPYEILDSQEVKTTWHPIGS